LPCLLETRPVPEPGSGSSRWRELADTLADCFAVLTASAGESPRRILGEHGITVLITTHFMEEVEYCDRLVIMAEGRILTEGTPAQIRMQQTVPGLAAPSMEQAFIALIEASEERAHA